MTDGLSRKEVEHVAKLARLDLSEAEKESLGVELSAVLAHVDAIRELDLSALAPTAHAFELSNVFRQDVVRESLDRDEVLAAAPEVEQNRFKVPRILGDPS